MQILPPKEFSPYIKHYLFLESSGDRHRTLRLFSDGNPGMVFLLDQEPLSSNPTHHLGCSFLYGQISHFKDIFLIEQASFVIIVFQPDGLYQLLGLPSHALKDQFVTAIDVFGKSIVRLSDRLRRCAQRLDQVYTLNNFFSELAFQRAFSSGNTLVQAVLPYVVQHKGLLSIEQLVRYSGYTERHLERLFAEQVGISPKKFVSTVQLHAFLKLLRSKPSMANLTTICHESGYFDQSHLIKTFKKHTGITPSEYLHRANKIAVNFMEINDKPARMSGFYNLSQ
ncbi:MAG: helix-turn-helix transcriptional regulator [Sphingobacterium sp.]|jgi:AraC-like DNA-binding protein|nr:helix-turn-helix transcriptional regulator [Sphingobacterium sp.]